MIEATLSPAPGFLTVAEAASRLSVTEEMVRHLIARGDLDGQRVGRVWFVREEDIERRASLAPEPGRRLTSARAWGLLYLAAGMPAPWLTATSRYRLRQLLKKRGLSALRARLVSRGARRSFRAHPSRLEALRRDPAVMLTGAVAASELRMGLGGVEAIEAYVAEAKLADIIRRYQLRESRDPNVLLRVVPRFAPTWPPARYAPETVIALDLLEDTDPRSRQVGAQLLARYAS